MRYLATTAWTPQQVFQYALDSFGPEGLGLEVTVQTNLGLVFQGGGGYVALTMQAGAETKLELETRAYDVAVKGFLVQLSQRRSWWPLWLHQKWLADSRPPPFTILNNMPGHESDCER